MPKTLNIAVIGAGTMAQSVHLPVLRRRWDRFILSAVVDHSPRRLRESSQNWGVPEERRFESVADLVSAVRAKRVEVDAVVLSTDGLHVDDLLALLRRGIPALVEPPLGFSAEEVARIVDFERMTGRRLVMMAYPQQYDAVVEEIAERIATRDLRLLSHDVLMPAAQPLFGHAKVTASAYDLPGDTRTQRRKDMQAAVEAGTGEGATQRDRDLYVKGLLTGVAHQAAMLEAIYGPIGQVRFVRHWPKGVIPGSIEVLAELAGGAPVRLMWHYLPFAPEYVETVEVLSARRRLVADVKAPSHGDSRSTLTAREKKSGTVIEETVTANTGSAEAMWQAFHAFVEKGTEPLAGPADELRRVELMRSVLASIVEADGRTLDPEPEPELESELESDSEEPAEPAERAEPGETVEPMGAAAPAETVESAEPAEAVETVGPVEPVEAAAASAPPEQGSAEDPRQTEMSANTQAAESPVGLQEPGAESIGPMTVSVDAAQPQADGDAQTNTDVQNAAGAQADVNASTDADVQNAAGPQADVNAWAEMDAKSDAGPQADHDEQRTAGA